VEDKKMDRYEEGISNQSTEGTELANGNWALISDLTRKVRQVIEGTVGGACLLQAVLLAALLTLGSVKVMSASTLLHTVFAAEEVGAQETQTANPPAQAAGEEQILSEEEFKEFLRNAKVVQFKQTSKGVTAPTKLTLSDGQRTVNAVFQSIDERKAVMQFPERTELNFRDSYKFNLAAYELAKLLGLGGLIPTTVEYRWRGNRGSLCYWVPAQFDEAERLKRNIQPPDPNAWNKQVNNMWVFSELIYDTDRNQTNMLIGESWKLWAIDFTRAFRLQKKLFDPRHVVGCSRQVLDKLRHLDEEQVLEATRHQLTKGELQGLMARRDEIVARLEALVSQKGEEHVLY
jgi:hypothetical protein